MIPREFPVSWEETSAPCQITETWKTAGLLLGTCSPFIERSNLVSPCLDEDISRDKKSRLSNSKDEF